MPTFQKYWSSIVLAILEILLPEEAALCLLLATSLSPLPRSPREGFSCLKVAVKLLESVSAFKSGCSTCAAQSVCVCVRCRFPSQQRSQHRGALRLAAAINKGLRQTRLALHRAGLCHRVCLVIAVLISLAAPELTGRGLEESERVKRENATCLQY